MPDVPLGTLNVQLKFPVVPVVNDPLVQPVIFTPSKTRVAGLDTENPRPTTVTLEPTGPVAGLTVIVNEVTLNVPSADAPVVSVATTVVPDVPLGTLNEQVNVPFEFVVRDPLVQLETATPSKTSDLSGVDAEKLWPVTVTDAPIGPWCGATVTVSGAA